MRVRMRRPERNPVAASKWFEKMPSSTASRPEYGRPGLVLGRGLTSGWSRINQSAVDDIGRSDLQDAATLRTVVGQAQNFRLRNHRVLGWQWRRLTCQAAIVKRSEEVADARSLVIGGPQVLLAVGLLAQQREPRLRREDRPAESG